MEQALAAHFGRPVKLKLVLDQDAPAVGVRPPGRGGGAGGGADGGTRSAPGGGRGRGRGPAEPPPVTADEEEYDWAELEQAPAVSSPEQRLLEAFPGAEEVQP